MSPSRRMDVVWMTEEINILGTSKTKYKSWQRKERRARRIKAGCLVCVLMSGIFHCAPNHNRYEQTATAPNSDWPKTQRGSAHIVKIIIMSSFLTDLELPSALNQPRHTL